MSESPSPTPAADEALPESFVGLLATQLQLAQSADLTALKSRVFAQLGPQATPPADAPAWLKLHSLAEIKFLSETADSFTWLLRLLPGGGLPAHTHSHGPETVLLVEGSLELGGVRYAPGDQVQACAGSKHGALYSRDGCLALLTNGLGFKRELQAGVKAFALS